MSSKLANGAILFMCNFPYGTGYAWSAIENYFIALSEFFSKKKIPCYIGYPAISGSTPERLSDNLKIIKYSPYTKLPSLKILKRLNIKLILLIDRGSWSLRYMLFRLAGVRQIIIYDHTSGIRSTPKGLKRLAKKILHYLPWVSADLYIGVSKFVTRRLIEVNCVPPKKVRCVYNGIPLEKFSHNQKGALYKLVPQTRGHKIVFFSGRMCDYKGVGILIESAAHLIISKKRNNLFFICCGNGPDLCRFKKMVNEKGIQDKFIFLGKRNDIHLLLQDVHVAVVPSLWAEACPLAVLEPMASGIPVIASRVGGIPEIIDDKKTGQLVEPGNIKDLSSAIEKLLDEKIASYISKEGKRKIEKDFSFKIFMDNMCNIMGKYVL